MKLLNMISLVCAFLLFQKMVQAQSDEEYSVRIYVNILCRTCVPSLPNRTYTSRCIRLSAYYIYGIKNESVYDIQGIPQEFSVSFCA